MSQKQAEGTSCYMDGVRVKIAEKYKPPPRINMGITYAQRLSLNKQLQDNIPTYNFQTDFCIKEKMKEWKCARSSLANEQKAALEKIKLENEALKEKQLEQVAQTNCNILKECEENALGAMLVPTQAKTFPTLIPKANPTISDYSPINISDFEPDSSPFDNLELKSLNDIEELKKVLQNEDFKKSKFSMEPIPTTSNANQIGYDNFSTSQNNYYAASYMPHSSNQMYSTPSTMYASSDGNGAYIYYPQNSDQYYYPANMKTSPVNNHFNTFMTNAKVESNALESISDIMRSLNEELSQRKPDESHKNSEIKGVSTESSQNNATESSTLNPYNTFSKQQQSVCKTIAGMGFPLDRVARVCKTIGNDEKKMVEHLLAMAQLLDLGFPEEKVSNALLESNNDRDKALEMLIL